jgi:hypothetical protein
MRLILCNCPGPAGAFSRQFPDVGLFLAMTFPRAGGSAQCVPMLTRSTRDAGYVGNRTDTIWQPPYGTGGFPDVVLNITTTHRRVDSAASAPPGRPETLAQSGPARRPIGKRTDHPNKVQIKRGSCDQTDCGPCGTGRAQSRTSDRGNGRSVIRIAARRSRYSSSTPRTFPVVGLTRCSCRQA